MILIPLLRSLALPWTRPRIRPLLPCSSCRFVRGLAALRRHRLDCWKLLSTRGSKGGILVVPSMLFVCFFCFAQEGCCAACWFHRMNSAKAQFLPRAFTRLPCPLNAARVIDSIASARQRLVSPRGLSFLVRASAPLVRFGVCYLAFTRLVAFD